jgi:hypothetical protein
MTGEFDLFKLLALCWCKVLADRARQRLHAGTMWFETPDGKRWEGWR